MEYVVVDDRGMKEGIPYYKLKDTLGDQVQGTFYGPELSKLTVTDESVNRVEKVLREKWNQALVKWMGWPFQFNSWIPVTTLKDNKRP